jgi:hypothetical protein
MPNDTDRSTAVIAVSLLRRRSHGLLPLLESAAVQWLKWLLNEGITAMRVSATEAKNRFGSLCAHAKREPVFVEKAGQIDSVILSAEHYQALQANQDKAARAARKKAFEAEFGDWIASQNARFEALGIPGADLRPW